MSDRHERVVHPRTGTSTGVIDESASDSRSVRRPSRMDVQQQMAALQPGALVAGRYRIERILGVGGMGAVYEATQVAIDRRVALKVVRADFAGDAAMAVRFQREARAASAVQHPNVVMVHDFGQDEDGTLFMVMELLSGESLLQKMRREGALAPREAVRIAIEVLSGLEAAHEAGVVHRDLKPDNVLLMDSLAGAPGKLKVLDFGIARIVDRSGNNEGKPADAGLTEVGQMLGTPRYMSPEAVARMPVGPAADLYALGAILFEMLVGHPVFSEKEPVILMGHHLRTPPPRLRSSLPPGVHVPRAIDELVDRLLSKQPTERPSSAAIARKVLLELDWSEPAPPPPPPPAPELPRRAPTGLAPLPPGPGAPAPLELNVFTPPPSEVVDPAQFVRGRSGLRRAMRFSPLILLAGGIAGLLYMQRIRLEETRQEQRTQIGAIVHEPPPIEAPPRIERVRMTIRDAPRAARFVWDGTVMESAEFDVPFDGRAHRLEVSARGYQTRSVDVVADGPHELRMNLDRARRRAPPPTAP